MRRLRSFSYAVRGISFIAERESGRMGRLVPFPFYGERQIYLLFTIIFHKKYTILKICVIMGTCNKKGSLELGFRQRFKGSVLKPVRIALRPAYRQEWDDAMALAWRTFMQFEAKDCTLQGVESFQDFITDTVLHRMFMMGEYQLFGAYDNGRMVGMISLRRETHISLLFVDEKYHGMGIGRALIEYVSNYVVTEEGHSRITVNAASGATGFYHCVGFTDTDREQTKDGIRYTPMERSIYYNKGV